MTSLSAYQRIWIVGASSGIGEALVKALDAPNRVLFVSARSQEPLEALRANAQAEVVPMPMDMTDTKQVDLVVGRIAELGALDMVILNAGTCEYMDSTDLDMALLRRVMETNLFSVAELMSKSLDLLRPSLAKRVESGSKTAPKLVVMSSSVTYQALPRAHAYGASKAALRYFTECLKAEIGRAHV